jgi:hypothetical protein
MDELKNRRTQIRFLQCTVYFPFTHTKVCGLVQFTPAFLQDYVARLFSAVLPECLPFYQAQSPIAVVPFFLFKCLTLMPVSLALYYVFYFKNKHYFRLA